MSLIWPDTSRGSCPTVMLWHDTPPDAAVPSHVDWLLAREPEGRSPLLTFRLARPLHELAAGAVANAQHIGDHRAAYLTYEGPVSGNRGNVTRLAEGQVRAARAGEKGAAHLVVCWPGAADCEAEMTVTIEPRRNSGNYQVKVLAIVPPSRYK